MNLKHLILLLCSMILSFSVLAQDNPSFQVEYICETRIVKGRSHDGLNTLYFSGPKSLYIHNEFPTETEWIERGDANRKVFLVIKGDSEGLPVFMNMLTDSMVYKTEYYSPHSQNSILTTKIPKIEWEILSLTQDIGGFSTRLAVGDFGGRTYEVWFTEEIPVPFGPYKLNGLPGLILEAFSRDGFVFYRFKSFKQIDDKQVDISPPSDGVKLTMDELIKFRIEDLYRVEAIGRVTHVDPDPNYEIEKNKWTIFGEYRKKRAEKRRQQRW